MQDSVGKENKIYAPTQRRIKQAVSRGDVPRSYEISHTFFLFSFCLFLFLAGNFLPSFAVFLQIWLRESAVFSVQERDLLSALIESGGLSFWFLFGGGLFLFLGGMASHWVQYRFVFSWKKMAPSLEKISPFSGFRRIFSPRNFLSFAFGCAKMLCVAGTFTLIFFAKELHFEQAFSKNPLQVLSLLQGFLLQISVGVLLFFGVFSVLDYLYQYRAWYGRQFMSLQELQEERKEQEGNSQVKQKQRKMAKVGFFTFQMDGLEKVTFLISSPSQTRVLAFHYTGKGDVPICLLKKEGSVARTICHLSSLKGIPSARDIAFMEHFYTKIFAGKPIPESSYASMIAILYRILPRDKILFTEQEVAS